MVLFADFCRGSGFQAQAWFSYSPGDFKAGKYLYFLIDWVAQITKFWLLWPSRRIQSSKKWMRTLRLDGKLPEILNFPITLWVSDLQNFVSDNFFFKEVVAELYLFFLFSLVHRLGNLSTFLESSQHLKGCSWVSLLKLMTNPWSCLKALMQGPLGHNAAPLVGS